MKLSISNIAWIQNNDIKMYAKMRELGYSGLEIAPTRIFQNHPYDRLEEARVWAKKLNENYGLIVSSMQSICYGRNERLFGSLEEYQILKGYVKKAIDFAESINCRNLVFGCPRNRNNPDGLTEDRAVSFFKELGDYAYEHGTVIGMEANPKIYNTNYINDTVSAIDLIRHVDSKGFLLNLDVGTMIENGEEISILKNKEQYINHVHISEPRLKNLERRRLHKELASFLNKVGYNKFISIEVGAQEDVSILEDMMCYVKDYFS